MRPSLRKRIAKALKTIYYDLFGWQCNKCGAEFCVYFYDSYMQRGKLIEIYKCKRCEVEGQYIKETLTKKQK